MRFYEIVEDKRYGNQRGGVIARSRRKDIAIGMFEEIIEEVREDLKIYFDYDEERFGSDRIIFRDNDNEDYENDVLDVVYIREIELA